MQRTNQRELDCFTLIWCRSTGTPTATPTRDELMTLTPEPTRTNNSQVASMSSVSASPSTSPSTAEKDASSLETCFPGSETVELDNGARLTMRQLKIGDRVRVSETEFSPVFLFTHRSAWESAVWYVRLTTKSNHSVVATLSHAMYIKKDGGSRNVAAGNIRVGDSLLTVAGWQIVTNCRYVVARGLYNPQTLHGNIVVNGVVVTTFTTAMDMYTANGLLLPLRALFRAGLISEQLAGSWWKYGVI